MEPEALRNGVDAIDTELTVLFLRRMDCARRVAEVKRNAGLPVRNADREEEFLARRAAEAGEFAPEARVLFSTLMFPSRSYQHRLLGTAEPSEPDFAEKT